MTNPQNMTAIAIDTELARAEAREAVVAAAADRLVEGHRLEVESLVRWSRANNEHAWAEELGDVVDDMLEREPGLAVQLESVGAQPEDVVEWAVSLVEDEATRRGAVRPAPGPQPRLVMIDPSGRSVTATRVRAEAGVNAYGERFVVLRFRDSHGEPYTVDLGAELVDLIGRVRPA